MTLSHHSLLFTADQRVFGFGNNVFGSLGLGPNECQVNQYTPVELTSLFEGDRAVEASVGRHHTVVRTKSGNILSFGKGEFGVLGTGGVGDEPTPLSISWSGDLKYKNIVKVVATQVTTFAFTDSNEMICWGYNFCGGCATGLTHTIIFVPTFVNQSAFSGKTIVSVSAGAGHTLFLDSEGHVYSVGRSDNGQLGTGVIALQNFETKQIHSDLLKDKRVVEISSGDLFNVVRTAEGELFSWGANTYGTLGDGTNVQKAVPVAVLMTGALSGKRVAAVQCGRHHTMLLTEDGSVLGFGSNSFGALGDGTQEHRNTPTPIFLTEALKNRRIVSVVAGADISALLTEHGEVFTSGNGESGSLGDVSFSRTTFNNGPSFFTGATSMPSSWITDQSIMQTATGRTYLSKPQIGNMWSEDEHHTIYGGKNFALLISSEGRLQCVGNNDAGNCGTLNFASSNKPLPVFESGAMFGRSFVQAAAGEKFSLFLSSSGEIFSSGTQENGELGTNAIGIAEATPVPIAVNMSGALHNKFITQIAAGDYHSLALSSNGAAFGWGRNDFMALCRPDLGYVRIFLPVSVDSSGILSQKTLVSISAGAFQSYFLTTDGECYACGYCARGQCGGNRTLDASEPVLVMSDALRGKKIIHISAGYSHVLLLTDDGQVFGFGDNSLGVLGDGTFVNGLSPVPVDLSPIFESQDGCPNQKQIVSVTAFYSYSAIQMSQSDRKYCFGLSSLDYGVCSGHGKCVEDNMCSCQNGAWGGPQCTLFACDGVLPSNASSVCSGRGKCHGPNQCECASSDWGGTFCSEPRCGKYYAHEVAVCGARGTCLGVDHCACEKWYFGEACSINGLYLTVFAMFAVIMCCCCIGVAVLVCVLCTVARLEKRRRLHAENKHHLTRNLLEGFQKDEEMDTLDNDASRARLIIKKSMFEIDFQEVEELKKIGLGGSGAVIFRGVWRGNDVAVKVFKSGMLSGELFFENFEHEVTMMTTLRHPKLINFFGCSLSYPRIAIIMEFCALGSIGDQIRNGAFAYKSLKDILHMLLDVAEGMHYLHSRNVVHRDLKSDNCLMDQNGTVKIADFGLSKMVSEAQAVHTTMMGTSYYMAPELIQDSGRKVAYDSSVDVFSFGIMSAEMLLKRMRPYPRDLSDFQIQHKVATDASFRPDLSAANVNVSLKVLLERCWSHDPNERASFAEIVPKLREVLEGL